MKSIVIGGGLVALMGWAYMNELFVAGSQEGATPANATYSVDEMVSPAPNADPEEYRTVQQVGFRNFAAEVYGVKGPVIVEFTASWCKPCQQQAPILEQFAWEHAGVKVVTVDTDTERDLAAQFRVTSIPTIVVMRGAEESRRHVGFADRDTLRALLY